MADVGEFVDKESQDGEIYKQRPTDGQSSGIPSTGFTQPKHHSEVDFADCSCTYPTIAIATGKIGPFHEQTVYCEECMHRFVSVMEECDRDG